MPYAMIARRSGWLGARRPFVAGPGDRALGADKFDADEAEVATCSAWPIGRRIFDLFEAVMAGKAPEALDRFDDMYGGGVDPLIVLQDLLDVVIG